VRGIEKDFEPSKAFFGRFYFVAPILRLAIFIGDDSWYFLGFGDASLWIWPVFDQSNLL
jgi:hypothetical protein